MNRYLSRASDWLDSNAIDCDHDCELRALEIELDEDREREPHQILKDWKDSLSSMD